MFTSRMCLLFCMCCAMLLAGARGDKVKLQVTPANTQELRIQAVVCEKETGVDASALNKLVQWALENNDINKRFLYCVAQKSGYIDGDGHLKKDKMLEHTVVEGKLEDYENSINDCAKIIASDPDKMFAVASCMYERIQLKTLDN